MLEINYEPGKIQILTGPAFNRLIAKYSNELLYVILKHGIGTTLNLAGNWINKSTGLKYTKPQLYYTNDFLVTPNLKILVIDHYNCSTLPGFRIDYTAANQLYPESRDFEPTLNYYDISLYYQDFSNKYLTNVSLATL